jgi:hypothetical protein
MAQIKVGDTFKPGELAPVKGVYQCTSCGKEEHSKQGDHLPPQNHYQHAPPKPILWKLVRV